MPPDDVLHDGGADGVVDLIVADELELLPLLFLIIMIAIILLLRRASGGDTPVDNPRDVGPSVQRRGVDVADDLVGRRRLRSAGSAENVLDDGGGGSHVFDDDGADAREVVGAVSRCF